KDIIVFIDDLELDALDRPTDARRAHALILTLKTRNGRGLSQAVALADPEAKTFVELLLHLERQRRPAAEAALETGQHVGRHLRTAQQPDVHRRHRRQKREPVALDELRGVERGEAGEITDCPSDREGS